MTRRIVVIQGYPDPKGGHLGHALAQSYVNGAGDGGHEVRRIDIAKLDFPLLRTKEAWEGLTILPAIRQAQNTILWAEHLVILYPLWLGAMPALLKAFLEQVMRPGFAIGKFESGSWQKLLATMGMPALVYRWFFRAHSLKSLERNILKFVGISPVAETLIGSIETCVAEWRSRWLDELHTLGRSAK